MRPRRKKLIQAFATVALALGGLFFSAAPALAGGPIVYRQAGNHYTPMYGAPYSGSGAVIQAWLNPGERFNMMCWTDNYGTTGNYYSRRWFRGQSFNHGYGWVHSSYVYYQWTVGRC